MFVVLNLLSKQLRTQEKLAADINFLQRTVHPHHYLLKPFKHHGVSAVRREPWMGNLERGSREPKISTGTLLAEAFFE